MWDALLTLLLGLFWHHLGLLGHYLPPTWANLFYLVSWAALLYSTWIVWGALLTLLLGLFWCHLGLWGHYLAPTRANLFYLVSWGALIYSTWLVGQH